MRNKDNTYKQAKVLLSAFIYFAIVIEKQDYIKTIPPKIKRLFHKLAFITEKYKFLMEDTTKEINEVLHPIEKDIDYLLMSATIIAEYYEQTRGKKRFFYPMSYEQILEVQDELCGDTKKEIALNTFDVAELLVKEILK